MLRPYPVVVPSVVVLPTVTDLAPTVADNDNAVHMVGHHHESIQHNGWEMRWNLTPPLLRDTAAAIETHVPRNHLSEHVASLSQTNGDEIRSRMRVIISAEP